MNRLLQFTLVALLLAGVLPLALRDPATEAQDIVKMYIVNPQTGDNVFNVSNRSVFTIEFYVGNVTDMLTWQIHLTYNRTLINYAKAWFPDDNVFKAVIDQGAIPTKEISVNVDNDTDTADLLIIMTCTYPPSSPQKYPVNVTSRGLLCKANFTVALHPIYEQLEFVSQQSNYSNLRVTPPYYLADFKTSVDTPNGIYIADGEPALIYDSNPVPEASLFLLLISILVTVGFALNEREKKEITDYN
jgi:hypothetical protein